MLINIQKKNKSGTLVGEYYRIHNKPQQQQTTRPRFNNASPADTDKRYYHTLGWLKLTMVLKLTTVQ